MSETQSAEQNGGQWCAAWLTAVIAVSAALTVGYWSLMALGKADTEPMESPLMLSVAHQLEHGPGELYGPFGGSNPLVLIHAPLYYRAAALLAWPIWRMGRDPVDAARLAGRLLSAMGLAMTLAAAYRLGRLDGLPRRAGIWSALLVAASPVLAGQPFAVRPDMVGTAFQTWGMVLALESLAGSGRGLTGASLLFGLAACVKQNLLSAWAVSVALISLGWIRNRLDFSSLLRTVLPGTAVLGVIYGSEWLVTAGRVWDAAFVVATHVQKVHPGSWDHVSVVFLGAASRSVGPAVLLAVAVAIAVGSRFPVLRWVAPGVSSVLIGLVLTCQMVQIFTPRQWLAAANFLATSLTAMVALLAAVLCPRRSTRAQWVDVALLAYLVAELGWMTVLVRTNAGAWFNYAIPSTVLVSVLVSRGLSRAVGAAPSLPMVAPVALGSLVLLASSACTVKENLRTSRFDTVQLELIYKHVKHPRSACFFIGRPGLNRLNGRLDLVYDDWLYPVFESMGLAESRFIWIRQALSSNQLRVVVSPTDVPLVGGTGLNLVRFGFRPDAKLEPHFFIWVR